MESGGALDIALALQGLSVWGAHIGAVSLLTFPSLSGLPFFS
jgi:hypothetical protein